MDGHVLTGRKVKLTVNGKHYLVEVLSSLSSSPVSVNVNGQPYVVDLEATEMVSKGEAPTEALNSVVRETAAPEKAPTPVAPAGPTVPHLKAPMPGVIAEILVKVGDRVKYGQHLLSLEAMKMKNALRAPRDGVVTGIEVSEGQTVNHGQVLVTFKVEGA